MRSRILLPLLTYPDATPVDALPRALDLAATLDGEVTAIVHEADIAPITEPFANLVLDTKAISSAAESLSRARGSELAKAVCHQAGRIALPLVVETLRCDRLCGELIGRRARTYDLTILLNSPKSADHALLEEEVLFRSGGPVVVIPAGGDEAHLSTVVVAWDGSRAAARALRDSMGLLKRAGRVIMVTVDDGNSTLLDGGADILAFLEAHEIDAKHWVVPLGAGTDIGQTLQRAAIAEGAGLLVMGAYGHSRMREFVLGGATKSVLRAPQLPLFMSH